MAHKSRPTGQPLLMCPPIAGATLLQLRPKIAAMRATPGTPDESVAQLYSDWLAANPQLTPADVQLSNLMCGPLACG